MILAIDIGNTTTGVALFSGDQIPTRLSRATGDLASAEGVSRWLDSLGVDWSQVTGAAFCTVVRSARQGWLDALANRGLEVMEVTSETITTLRNDYADPAALGADRYLAALSAFERYGAPVIVVSVGTAITVDAVSAEGVFLGGAIAPGISAGRPALADACDLLPEVEVSGPSRALARETDAAIRAGLVFGAAGAINELVSRIAQEAAVEPRVVVSGGDSDLVARYLDHVVVVDRDLVLHGLRIAWEQTRGAAR